MRVDIIIPNFDESSSEVTLTAWYKKIGEKISKNEVIADAETDTIACGVTSAYDCLLAKILVSEGDVITQGSIIAVIETDVNASDVASPDTETPADILKKSQTLDKQMNEESDSFKAQKQEEKKAERAMPDATAKSADNSSATSSDYSRMDDNAADDDTQSSSGTTDHNVYSLSAQNGDAFGSSSSFSSTVDSEMSKIESEIIRNTVVEDLPQECIDDTEEVLLGILKNAEKDAKNEAKKIRDKIIEEATNQANLQAEKIRADIIKSCEEKATEEANSLHKKVLETSIEECDKIKSRLISEAIEKAKQEAEEQSRELLNKKHLEAKDKAEKMMKNIIESAKSKAKDEANDISKNIIERSINEANCESKAIKKDMIHSARKHAEKKALSIVYEAVDNAKKQAKMQSEEILASYVKTSSEQAQEIVNSTLQNVSIRVDSMSRDLSESMYSIARTEIENLIRHTVHNMRSDSENYVREIVENASEQAKLESREIVANTISSAKNYSEIAAKGMIEAIASLAAKEAEHLKNAVIKNEVEKVAKNVKSALCEIEDVCEDKIRTESIINSLERINAEKVSVADRTHSDNKSTAENVRCDDQATIDALKSRLNDIEHEMRQDTPHSFSKKCNAGGNAHEQFDFLKKRISEKLTDSVNASVISTVSNEVDMGAIISLEKTFGKEFSSIHNTRLGFTPFFIKACISALKKIRIFNAHIVDGKIIYKGNFDISIITCGNNGVLAPVIKNANQLTIAEIEKDMISLSRRAIDGTISMEEVLGGTFTVVNAGVYGAIMGTDLLTPPQVATLSVHKMTNRPVATDNGVEVRPMLYISLSYDHRVADTQKASEFLDFVKQYVENPGWQMLGIS